MKVGELIDRLREFDSHAEVYLQLDRRSFAPPVWVGILDIAGLFDEEKDFQLVISCWEPEAYRQPESGEQQAFVDILMNPPKPNDALRAAAADYFARVALEGELLQSPRHSTAARKFGTQ
jgi:hypothetical protein